MVARILTLSLLLYTADSFTQSPSQKKTIAFRLTVARSRVFLAKNSNSPQQKKGFQQYGEINEAYCNISKQEILDLIRERNKARRSRNFDKADVILATLNRNNVHLNDSKKLWRADGDVFDVKGYAKMEYKKSSRSKPISPREEEYVNQKLNERSEAKLRRDFNTADDILDELRFLKNVVVDDSALTWRVAEDFKSEYSYGGRRLNNVPEEEIKNIERLIRERSNAKDKKNYDVADEILEKLTVICGVRVDDAKKAWYFLPKIHDEHEGGSYRTNSFDRRDGNKTMNPPRRGKDTGPRAIRSKVPDWSVAGEISDGVPMSDAKIPMPDGVTLDKDSSPSMPEGISIPNNDPQFIPEGISIEAPEGISITSEDSNGSASKKSSISKTELQDCTVPVLKEKLRDAGLPVSGRKAELIDRLLER